jgi:hypothetical protein
VTPGAHRGRAESVAGARVCVLEGKQNRCGGPPTLLIPPERDARLDVLPWPGAHAAAPGAGSGTLYKLLPGIWRPLAWRRQGAALHPEETLRGAGPLLFTPGA